MKPPVLVLCVGSCILGLIIGLLLGGQRSQHYVRSHLAALGKAQLAYDDIKSNVEDVRSCLEDLKAKKGDLKTLEKSVEAVELCVDDLNEALSRR